MNSLKGSLPLLDYLNGDILGALNAQQKEYFANVWVIPTHGSRIIESNVNKSDSIKELLNRTIAISVRTGNYRSTNCLALGYRPKRVQFESGLTSFPDIECDFANSLHSLITTSLWQVLADLVGSDMMLHLLESALFMKIDNGCSIQLSGTPLPELIRQQRVVSLDIPIPRHKLFYNSSSQNMIRSRLTRLKCMLLDYHSASDALSGIFASVSACKLDDPVCAVLTGVVCSVLSHFLVLPTTRILSRCLRRCGSHVSAADSDYASDGGEQVRGRAKRCSREVAMAGDDQHSLTEQSKQAGQSIKRTRRGCRAGRQVKQRTYKQSELNSSISAPSSVTSPLAHKTQTPLIYANKSNQNQQQQQQQRLACTVGRYVFDKLLCAGLSAQRVLSSAADTATQPLTLPMALTKPDSSVRDSGTQSDREGSGGSYHHMARPLSTSDCMPRSSSASAAPLSAASLSAAVHQCVDPSSRIESVTVAGAPISSCRNPKHATSRPKQASPLQREDRGLCTAADSGRGTDKDKPLASAVALSTVCEFAKSVCRLSLPCALVWGCRRNESVFLAAVDRYVRLGRQDTVTAKQLCLGIRASRMPWIRHCLQLLSPEVGHCSRNECDSQMNLQGDKDDDNIDNGSQDNDVDSSEHDAVSGERDRRRRAGVVTSVCHEFVWWIFAEFLTPLLSSSFYVTEAEGAGAEVRYYEKSKWAAIMRVGAQQLSHSFVQIAGVLAPQRFPLVRFVPKPHSVRPITNLRRPQPLLPHNAGASGGADAIVSNVSLYGVLHVLKRVTRHRPLLLGFGSVGFDDVFLKLKSFRQSLAHSHCTAPHGPPFFMAALDLEKCFDNVDTAKLFNLVKSIMITSKTKKKNKKRSVVPLHRQQSDSRPHCSSKRVVEDDKDNEDADDDDELVVHKYSVCYEVASMGRVLVKNVRHVTDKGQVIPFTESAKGLATAYRRSVLTDGVTHTRVSRRALLQVLKMHLFSHIVTMTHDMLPYTQVKGIPQGSVLSPMLCNLYYGHAEMQIFGSEEHAARLGLGENTMIVRLMDDYLVISTDKAAVVHFIQRAQECLKPYGSGINPLKTKVNFDCHVESEGRRVRLPRSQCRDDDNNDNNEGDDASGRGWDMQWCGFVINSHTLCMRPCWKRLLSRPLSSQVIVDWERAGSGLGLRRVLKGYTRTKCHALVLSDCINSYESVAASVYSIFAVAAWRGRAYIRKTMRLKKDNAKFVVASVRDCVQYGARLAQSRARAHLRRPLEQLLGGQGRQCDSALVDEDKCCDAFRQAICCPLEDRGASRCAVPTQEMIYLGLRAFSKVFSRCPRDHVPLLAALERLTHNHGQTLNTAVRAQLDKLCMCCDARCFTNPNCWT